MNHIKRRNDVLMYRCSAPAYKNDSTGIKSKIGIEVSVHCHHLVARNRVESIKAAGIDLVPSFIPTSIPNTTHGAVLE